MATAATRASGSANLEASRAARAPRTCPMCDKHSSATSSRLRRTHARLAHAQAAGCVSAFAARNARSLERSSKASVIVLRTFSSFVDFSKRARDVSSRASASWNAKRLAVMSPRSSS